MTSTQQARPKKTVLLDFLFVVALPMLCFALDPIFVEWPEPTRYALYLLVVTLATLFWLSYIPWSAKWIQRLLNGSLLLGALPATGFGAVLLPLTLVGLLFLIGLLGLIPFATAWRFKTRFALNGGAWPKTTMDGTLLVFGIMLPCLVPAILYHEIDNRLESDIQAILVRDTRAAAAAIKKVGSNWFCQKNCVTRISQMFLDNTIDMPEPEFRVVFRDAMGEEYDSWNLSD